MRINNNIMAMNTQRQLGTNATSIAKAMEKLSSGFRINRAGDDAAGLAISEKMRGQIRGLNQASRNAQDGISMIQSAEGALSEVHAMVQRIRELAVQANNGTNTEADLDEIQKEITELNGEITRVATKTEFNTKTLLDGSIGVSVDAATKTAYGAHGITVNTSGIAGNQTVVISGSSTAGAANISATLGGVAQTISIADTVAAGTVVNFDKIGISLSFGGPVTAAIAIGQGNIVTQGTNTKFQIGANQDTVLDITISSMKADSIGTGVATAEAEGINSLADINVINGDFDLNILVIDKAVAQVSAQRSQLGAWQNRLEHTIKNLDTTAENLQSSESRIRDVDMAKEIMDLTKHNILQQAATAMLAQANQAPQTVLQLLQ